MVNGSSGVGNPILDEDDDDDDGLVGLFDGDVSFGFGGGGSASSSSLGSSVVSSGSSVVDEAIPFDNIDELLGLGGDVVSVGSNSDSVVDDAVFVDALSGPGSGDSFDDFFGVEDVAGSSLSGADGDAEVGVEDAFVSDSGSSSFIGDTLDDLRGDASEDFSAQDIHNALSSTYVDSDDENNLHIDVVLTRAIDLGASDVHITPDDVVSFSVLGNIVRWDGSPVISGNDSVRSYAEIVTHQLQASFAEESELDTSYVLRSGPYAGRRFRLSVGKTFDMVFMVFRVISDVIPSPDELGVPQSLRNWTKLSNGLVMVNGPTGTGKDVVLSTKIITPCGVKTMGDIEVGDEVYDSAMNICRVQWISDVNVSPDLYRVVLSDGQEVLAGKDHQWVVSDRVSRHTGRHNKYMRIEQRKKSAHSDAEGLRALALELGDLVLPAKNIFDLVQKNGLGGEIRSLRNMYKMISGMDYHAYDGQRNYSVQEVLNVLANSLLARFVYNEKQELRTVTTEQMVAEGIVVNNYRNFAIPVVGRDMDKDDVSLICDPYVLGVWLGEGISKNGDICVEDEDVESLRTILGDTDYDFSVKNHNSGVSIFKLYNKADGKTLRSVLSSLRLIGNKHIPYVYLTGSFVQRLSLLQGLMDTDGTVDKTTGVCEFSSSDEVIANDVLSLVRSLGIKARIHEGKAGYKNSDGEYVVCKNRYRIIFTTDLVVFRLDRKRRFLKGHVRDTQRWNYIVSVDKVEDGEVGYEPTKCIGVDSADHTYLCADYVVTHNSTTLASLLQEIQLSRAQNIITIERPVEFIYGVRGKALVKQREVGRDTRSFEKALTSAMRQAPDIIMVGEVRDQVEVDALLRAAETGHLTISTMHTNSAPATINRIKSLYSGSEQARVLGTLSDVSRGFANQVLVRSVAGDSRFAVHEVLDVGEDVRRMILRGDVEALRGYQLENRITLEHVLARVVSAGKCSADEALRVCNNPVLLRKLLKIT